MKSYKSVLSLGKHSGALLLLLIATMTLNLIQYHSTQQLHSQVRALTNNNTQDVEKISSLNDSLQHEISSYKSIRQAVLKDPAHADELGANSYNFCNPSSKVPHTVSVNPKLTQEQKDAQCVQTVYDTFIDDYLQQYAQ